MSPVRLMPRSLRTRLVVVFAFGTSMVLALCLTLLYAALDQQLRDALDAGLASRSADLAASVGEGDLSVLRGDPMAQLYAADGTTTAGSSSLADRRLLSAGEARAVRGDRFDSRSLPLGRSDDPVPVRLLSRRVGPAGQVLTVGVSAEPVQTARERLLAVLLIAAPLLIAALAAAGWLVVRAALRPVDVLTREAAAISSLDPDRRLPEVPGDDEIARLAHTLDDMLVRLEVAFARERAFVDDASHELRTPIAVLRGEIELALSATHEPDEVERSLQVALGQADRLSRLAEDLLLLARERAGSLVVRRESIDLLDLAIAAAHRLQPVLGLRIEVSGDPVIVAGDADRLRQVLANLAANSSAAGASLARVRVTGEPAFAVVEVADDGPGFRSGLVDSAFERFVRGDEARTRGMSGAGLGLSIVRAVVSAHGGTVEARNGPPLGGAVVTVRLPAE